MILTADMSSMAYHRCLAIGEQRQPDAHLTALVSDCIWACLDGLHLLRMHF